MRGRVFVQITHTHTHKGEFTFRNMEKVKEILLEYDRLILYVLGKIPR